MKFQIDIVDPNGEPKAYKGNTVDELFDKLQKEFKDIKVKSSIRLYLEDGRIKDLFLYPRVIKKLQNHELFRELYRKRIKMMLGEI